MPKLTFDNEEREFRIRREVPILRVKLDEHEVQLACIHFAISKVLPAERPALIHKPHASVNAVIDVSQSMLMGAQVEIVFEEGA